jgi:UDP-glucuronate 4-epimerase
MARLLLDEAPLPVFGDGSARRDYTFIDDIVEGIFSALRYEATPYEIVNLGNNRTVSLTEMVHALEDTFGVPARIKPLPPMPGDVPQTWASLEKAERVLGYRPRYPFSAGLAKFRDWLLEDLARSAGRAATALP